MRKVVVLTAVALAGWFCINGAGLLHGQQKPDKKYGKPKPGTIGLKGYHGKVVANFAMTPGFGRERMRLIRTVKENEIQFSLSDLDQLSPLNEQPELAKVNKDLNFFFATLKYPRGFMYGYLNIPKKTEKKAAKKDKTRWRIDAIDLIGLMDADNAVVYDSHVIWSEPFAKFKKPNGKKKDDKSLPKKAREPDFFEWAGIAHLQNGNDLFAKANDKGLRMVGALRATKRCAACHETEEGALLGALSYTMRRTK